MLRKLFVAVSLMGFALLTTACGAATDCHADEVCDCAGQGSCVWNCVDEGCAFTTNSQGTVTLTCDKGGCSLTAAGQETLAYDCAGGGCTANMTGQGTLSLTCEGGGCSTTCGGQSTCNTAATCTDCTCNETEITASCG